MVWTRRFQIKVCKKGFTNLWKMFYEFLGLLVSLFFQSQIWELPNIGKLDYLQIRDVKFISSTTSMPFLHCDGILRSVHSVHCTLGFLRSLNLDDYYLSTSRLFKFLSIIKLMKLARLLIDIISRNQRQRWEYFWNFVIRNFYFYLYCYLSKRWLWTIVIFLASYYPTSSNFYQRRNANKGSI